MENHSLQDPPPNGISLPDNGHQIEETNQTRRRESITSAASMSILQRLLQSEYNGIRKVAWCLIIVTCSAVCFWQLTTRIQYYLEEPTAFLFKVENVNEIHFPAITVCPAKEPFNSDDWTEAFKLKNFSESPKSNVSLEDIWSEYSMREEDLTLMASCNESNYCDFLNSVNTSMNAKILPTFWGMCITLSRDAPIEYRGASTYLEVFLLPGNYGRIWFGRSTAAQFFFHDPIVAHRHEAFLLADLWSENRDTVVQLILKEYYFLNSSRNPCDSQEEVIDCKNKCIDEKLDRVVNCSLPFMTSIHPVCRNAAEAKLSFDQTREFYYNFNSNECICRRQCVHKLYSANTNTADKRHDNRTALILQFADNTVERVFEEYDYSFSALVSDVGGSLGIFLGVSILSLLQIFETAFDTFKKRKKKA